MLTIYHNPRCGKSRQTLKIIEDSKTTVEVIKYLEETPSKEQLKKIIGKLGLRIEQIIRKNEAVFKEKYKGMEIQEEEWYGILAENPILIERPIVVKGNKAILGRPPENVRELL